MYYGLTCVNLSIEIIRMFRITFQTCALGLTRSDYMVDCTCAYTGEPDGELRLRQIEINTIASGMCGLGQDKVRNLHQ